MSTSTEGVGAFQWDLADRLAKTLRVVDMSATDMAEHLEVHRNTVGNWLRGQGSPNGAYLRVWAMRVGAPYEWLRYGTNPSDGPNDDGGPGGLPTEPVNPLLLPRVDSNHEPSGYWQQTDKAAA